MIDRDKALKVARSVLGRRTGIAMEESEVGWLAWPSAPPADGSDPARFATGQALVVVDRETGEPTTWPALPPDAIVALHTEHRTVDRRLGPEVRAALEAAGWRVGMRYHGRADAWLQRDEVAAAFAGFVMNDAAREIIDRFGTLRLGPSRPGEPGPAPATIYPSAAAPTLEAARRFRERAGIDAFPVGETGDATANLMVDSTGQLRLATPDGDRPLGDVYDTITHLLLGR